MRRSLAVGLLGAAVLVLGLGAGPVQAGKGGFSSGGRSFSAPSGRSYSSGGSKPFSAPSGRSYSSGGSTKPFSAPSGRSWASGSGTSRPATPAPSGRTYSSGQTSPAQPSTGGKTSPTAPTGPSGRSYTSGGSSATKPNVAVSRPPVQHFDSLAADAQKKQESRAQYVRGQAPATEYKDPKGEVRRVDPKDQRIQVLRDQLDHERWVNRVQREQVFYHDYWSRPIVVYHDPYNSYFWWWLLDQNAQTRALWYYNHQQVVDQARYQELLNRDAMLEARLRQLQAEGVARNPAAVPPGVPPDLVYTDGYVNAAYNPQPPAAPVYTPPSPVVAPVVYRHPAVSFWHGVRVLMYAFVVLAILSLLVWLVFFKRWGVRPT